MTDEQRLGGKAVSSACRLNLCHHGIGRSLAIIAHEAVSGAIQFVGVPFHAGIICIGEPDLAVVI